MQIIPAIDIIDGKCVRLVQGDYMQKKIYNERPLEVAKQFEDAGLNRLHLVDLDGAKAKNVKNWKVLEEIASNTNLIIDFGGGITTDADVKLVLTSGAALVTVGSIAVKNEQLLLEWMDRFGAEKFFLGADVKENKIAIHGWIETTTIDVFSFIRNYLHKGIKQVFCTDVGRDGKLEGPAIDLYTELLKQLPALQLVASGGVSCIDDLYHLKQIGCSGAIVGKAIYEQKITLEQLKAINEAC